ncbi:hypothetical protein [Natronincola ferrireducens]|uniref:Uncharacterized protein n=1 Tax=Natronincola ferrireducens TaxID=393762 RepID=A0A1G9IIS6_9FIRM|nr:hypothetical protein [Natronincola ferrireducens]SDL25080.1 hypothetical protein SAMN05660472_02885 [Natronincola ferrireducens]
MKKIRKQRKLRKKQEENFNDYIDSDENFYFIVGYTSGGAPYGITWEEASKDGLIEKDSSSKKSKEDDKIPF